METSDASAFWKAFVKPFLIDQTERKSFSTCLLNINSFKIQCFWNVASFYKAWILSRLNESKPKVFPQRLVVQQSIEVSDIVRSAEARWPSYLWSIESHRWNKGNDIEIQEGNWLSSWGASRSHRIYCRGIARAEKVWRTRTGNFEGLSFLLHILWALCPRFAPTCFSVFRLLVWFIDFCGLLFVLQDTKNRIHHAIESIKSDALVICEKCIILRENRTGIGM